MYTNLVSSNVVHRIKQLFTWSLKLDVLRQFLNLQSYRIYTNHDISDETY